MILRDTVILLCLPWAPVSACFSFDTEHPSMPCLMLCERVTSSGSTSLTLSLMEIYLQLTWQCVSPLSSSGFSRSRWGWGECHSKPVNDSRKAVHEAPASLEMRICLTLDNFCNKMFLPQGAQGLPGKPVRSWPECWLDSDSFSHFPVVF